jgi:uncharacterized protein (DUF3084 family)
MNSKNSSMDERPLGQQIADLKLELLSAQQEIAELAEANTKLSESLETWKSIARKSDEEKDAYKSKLESLKVIINAL